MVPLFIRWELGVTNDVPILRRMIRRNIKIAALFVFGFYL